MATNTYEVPGDWQYVRLKYTDVQSGGKLDSDGQIEIGTLAPGGICDLGGVIVHTAAAGASDIVANIGYDAADPDEIVDALDLDGLTKATFNTGTDFNDGTTANTVNVLVNNTASAKSIVVDIAGTVADLTAGEWTFLVRTYDLQNIAGR